MQEPSAPLTRSLRQELKSLNESLIAAASTDDQVVKLWNGARPDIALLLSGPDNLERFFAEQERSQGLPGSGQGASLLDLGEDEVSGSDSVLAELGAQVSEIDEALGRLNKIKRERGEVLRDLKEKVCPIHRSKEPRTDGQFPPLLSTPTYDFIIRHRFNQMMYPISCLPTIVELTPNKPYSPRSWKSSVLTRLGWERQYHTKTLRLTKSRGLGKP